MKFSGHKKIWGLQKKLAGIDPNAPVAVTTGLKKSTGPRLRAWSKVPFSSDAGAQPTTL